MAAYAGNAFKGLAESVVVAAKSGVKSVSEGKDALGEVRVTIEANGRHYPGKGVSTDVIEAAAQAYLKALNRADADRILPAESSTQVQAKV